MSGPRTRRASRARRAGRRVPEILAALALPALIGFTPACAPATDSHAADTSLGAHPLWDDGRAEYSHYVGTTERYGEPRPTKALLVVVKEDLLLGSLVKSEAGPVPGRTVEVLKLNLVADFPTGSYDYHQMVSVFLQRASLSPLKLAMTHSEACGITYVRVAGADGRWTHEAHSYWEGEADRTVSLHWPADRPSVMADALPLWLRQQLAQGPPGERAVWLLPSQLSGRAPLDATRPVHASCRFADGGRVTVPAGAYDTWRATVRTASAREDYWFDRRWPHVMVKMEKPGRTLELRRTQRLDYWNRHAVGDERLVE